MSTRKRQNLFEVDNARNLTRDELVATFVPTQSFWRLISAQHHVVLGSRGSGKTAIAKMLSHDHLSRMDNRRAQSIVRHKDFIGIYVPTELEWVSGLKNKPWQTEQEREEFFQWRLNLSTCVALIVTLRSCLECYVADRGRRAALEADLATEIARVWSDRHVEFQSLRSVEKFLRDTEHTKQLQLAKRRAVGKLEGDEPIGLGFAIDLFSPLRAAIRIASELFGFPERTSWLLCIDEAEFLQEIDHRILNSYLRAHSKSLFFKITTMPYHHYTLATNTTVPLNVGHDFEYVYIDQDPVVWAGGRNAEGRQFAETIFCSRARISGTKFRGMTLGALLGQSKLLQPKSGDWSATSNNMRLLRTYANSQTQRRAIRLSSDPTRFMDQIGRKIIPALMLRDAVQQQKGRGEIDVYSGDMMAIRCGDANPRRLIRLFNRFLLEIPSSRSKQRLPIPQKQQTRIFKEFSTNTLNPVQSEENVGPELYDLLDRIGTYMHNSLHHSLISSDQLSSILVDLRKSEHAQLVRKAVALGFLFPNKSARKPNYLPDREGKFHLAYVLAPHFEILPRRGKAVRLSRIVRKNPFLPCTPLPIQPALGFQEH